MNTKMTKQNNPVVDSVIRADDRDPSYIFKHGFQTWGNNDYLLYHATGQSVSAPDAPASLRHTSNFVATTNLNRITEMSNLISSLTLNSPPDFIWVYSIQPDRNFYHVPSSLEHALEIGPCTPDVERLIDDQITAFRDHNEYVARGGIPRERISAAIRWRRVLDPQSPRGYRWEDDPGSIIENPDFENIPDPGTNPSPYPRIVNRVDSVVRRTTVALTPRPDDEDGHPQERSVSRFLISLAMCLSGVRRNNLKEDGSEKYARLLDLRAVTYIASGGQD